MFVINVTIYYIFYYIYIFLLHTYFVLIFNVLIAMF